MFFFPKMLREIRETILRPGARILPEGSDPVLKDPRFGLCTLTRFARKRKGLSCTEYFWPLPLMIVCLQWLFFGSLLVHEIRLDTPWCPSGMGRFMYAGISLLYGTRIPALWDTYSDGMGLGKRACPCWTSLFDTLHEHFLSLLVFVLNLTLVVRSAPLDMLLNCVALEFVSNLDNEFQEKFLERVPLRGEILESFVDPEGAAERLRASPCLRWGYAFSSCCLSFLSFCLLLLYPLCLLAIVWGFAC